MAKYIYGNVLGAFETAKSADVAGEFQKVETVSATEETRVNDSIKFPAGEGNDIRITEIPAQRVDKVLGFGASGEIVLVAGLTASVATCEQAAIDTAADVVLTHADVVLTHADVVLTGNDVDSTNADVIAASGFADAAEAATAGMATLTGTETLTNKTLAEPVINSPTINGVTAYGLVLLDTPELLVEGSAEVLTWTQFDMSAGGTAAAQAAADGAIAIIVKVQSFGSVSAGSGGISITHSVYAQPNGTGLTPSRINAVNYSRIVLDTNDVVAAAENNITENTIKLDSNSDFEYYMVSNADVISWAFMLVGYYV